MKTELVTNATELNHLRMILGHVRTADRISVSTAFLCTSGLNLIAAELKKALLRGTSVEFYCGLDLSYTEPDALQTLYDMCRRSLSAKVFLVGSSGNAMFHPKLYYFRKGGTSHMVVGSANLTRGGLVDNYEISAAVTVRSSDPLATEAEQLFDKIAALPGSQHATNLAISQYRAKYDKYHARMDRVRDKAKKEASVQPKLDLNKAERYLERYRRADDGERTFKGRLQGYGIAHTVLEQMCRPGLTREEFVAAYDRLTKKPDHLWASDSLWRSQKGIFAGYRHFVNVVSLVRRSTDQEPGKLFDAAMGAKPKGMGRNQVTEVMATYAPDSFAILNKRPVAVLRDLACEPFPTHFSEGSYRQYNRLLSDLRERFHFKSLLQVDHFFNWYYDHVGL